MGIDFIFDPEASGQGMRGTGQPLLGVDMFEEDRTGQVDRGVTTFEALGRVRMF